MLRRNFRIEHPTPRGRVTWSLGGQSLGLANFDAITSRLFYNLELLQRS